MTTADSPHHFSDLYQHDAVAQPLPGLDVLTDDHLRIYREQGFLAVENVFSPQQVEAAKQAMNDLVAGKVESFDGIQFEGNIEAADKLTLDQKLDAVRKFMRFIDHEPRLAAFAEDPTLIRTITRLMDDRTPRMFQDMAMIKPPHCGREKPWHQDDAYFNIPTDTPVVGVWIALDPATIENGCMRMLAGAHTSIGPIHHWQRRDWQICDADLRRLHDKKHPVIAAPLKPGGVLFFSGLTPHGTPTNQSSHRRRALQFHYCPADAQWFTEDDRLAIWGTEGENVSC